MTEEEKKKVCSKFEQIKEFFSKYESYISENRIKIKKSQIIKKSIYFK